MKQIILLVTIALLQAQLLSSQEAQKSINLSSQEGQKSSDQTLVVEVNKFTEEFIQPMIRGESYNITIGDIQLVPDYQKSNPIKCGFPDDSTFERNGCHDRASYFAWHDNDYFDQESVGKVTYPFTSTLNKYQINPVNSIIIPISINLKSEFKKALLLFLKAQTDGINEISYANLPKKKWSAAGRQNKYINCMREFTNMCSGSLSRYGGELFGPVSSGDINSLENFVINFIDRKQKKVTFFNLKNYRQELLRTREYRYLTNLCYVMGDRTSSRLDTYTKPHLAIFDDIEVTFSDKNGDSIHRVVINTQGSVERLGINYESSTNGIALENHFIFAYDYGSNAIKGRTSDHMGWSSMIGHLINDTRHNFSRGCGSFYGVWSDTPAFSLVSNYEYNLIVQLNKSLIQQIASVDIKYVPGDTSLEEMVIIR